MKSEERRSFPVTTLRASGGVGAGAKIIGYTAVFGKRSQKLGDFYEVVQPGAFAESIEQDDIRALWQHDSSVVLGRTKSGTLRLSEDSRGVHVAIDPPSWATPQVETIKRGDVDQMSFGFRTIEDRWSVEDGQTVRTLVKAQLLDVSPATFASYPQTEVAVRSLRRWQERRAGTPALARLRAKQRRVEASLPSPICPDAPRRIRELLERSSAW